MGCRRMLGVEDRAAIMTGVDAGLSQTRIAHLIGRSPSVVCREIARHTGPDGQYRAEEADKVARAARRRPKKRLLDCDEVLRRRVIADLSQGHTPRQISGRLREEACGTLPSMDASPDAQGHTISHEAIYTWIYAHPKKTLIEHGICLPSRRWMRKKPPASGRKPPIVGMRLIDERPDISDRKIPGNWEGDLIIGQDGASACATLVERTTRYLIIVALPLGRKADQVCDALTRRIQGLPEGAMRTLTWDQGREMARHQRLTHDTGVEVFFAHPHSPWERGTNENTNRLIRRYLPKGTPHHQLPTLPRRHRRRAGQLSQSHPRLPHPHRSIQRTHCYHPLTPPGVPKGFGHGIVPAHSGPPHRHDSLDGAHMGGQLLEGEPCSPISMQHDPCGEGAARGGSHVEHGDDHVSALLLTHGLSQDPSRMCITHGAQVDPAMRAPQIGEICDPHPIQGVLIPPVHAVILMGYWGRA